MVGRSIRTFVVLLVLLAMLPGTADAQPALFEITPNTELVTSEGEEPNLRTTTYVIKNVSALQLEVEVALDGETTDNSEVEIELNGEQVGPETTTLLDRNESAVVAVTQQRAARFGDDGGALVLTVLPMPGLLAGHVRRLQLPDQTVPAPDLSALAVTTRSLWFDDAKPVRVPLAQMTCFDVVSPLGVVGTLYSNDRSLDVKASCVELADGAHADLEFTGTKDYGQIYSGTVTLGGEDVQLSVGLGRPWWIVLSLLVLAALAGWFLRLLLHNFFVRARIKSQIKQLGAGVTPQDVYACAIEKEREMLRGKLAEVPSRFVSPAKTDFKRVEEALVESVSRVARIRDLEAARKKLPESGSLPGLTSYRRTLRKELGLGDSAGAKHVVPHPWPPASLDVVEQRIARCAEATAISRRWPAAGVRALLEGKPLHPKGASSDSQPAEGGDSYPDVLKRLGVDAQAAIETFRVAAMRAVSQDDVSYALARYDEAQGQLHADIQNRAVFALNDTDNKGPDKLTLAGASDAESPELVAETRRLRRVARTGAVVHWAYAFGVLVFSFWLAFQQLFVGEVFGTFLDYVSVVALGFGGGALSAKVASAFGDAAVAEKHADQVRDAATEKPESSEGAEPGKQVAEATPKVSASGSSC